MKTRRQLKLNTTAYTNDARSDLGRIKRCKMTAATGDGFGEERRNARDTSAAVVANNAYAPKRGIISSELKRQLACGISRRSAEASSIKEFGHSSRRLAMILTV